jgi:hypothetical protein
MARNYRKVDRATELLRRAVGAYAAVDPQYTESAWYAFGYSRGLLEEALEILQAGTVVRESDAFVQGYEDISALMTPLPFPEA